MSRKQHYFVPRLKSWRETPHMHHFATCVNFEVVRWCILYTYNDYPQIWIVSAGLFSSASVIRLDGAIPALDDGSLSLGGAARPEQSIGLQPSGLLLVAGVVAVCRGRRGGDGREARRQILAGGPGELALRLQPVHHRPGDEGRDYRREGDHDEEGAEAAYRQADPVDDLLAYPALQLNTCQILGLYISYSLLIFRSIGLYYNHVLYYAHFRFVWLFHLHILYEWYKVECSVVFIKLVKIARHCKIHIFYVLQSWIMMEN